jgi:ABC-type Fe3+ transport system substrate-binding protein
VAKGKLLIGIGSGDTYTVEMIRKGLPIKYVDPTVLREGVYLTSGTGTLVVVQATPHPNATKIYLDYLLSQEGQLAWSRAVSQVSTRRDVPVDHLLKEFVPEEGVKYQANYKEHYVKLSPEIVAFLKTVMAR